MKEINAAYEVLGNPNHRVEYDKRLEAKRAPRATTGYKRGQKARGRRFFVEFRFHGHAKYYLRGLIREVARKFRVRGAIRHRPVPHMTLYGPSQTDRFQNLFSKIEKVAQRYTLVPFIICDFDSKDGEEGKVIAALINASPELKSLRRELAAEIIQISSPKPWDKQDNYWFHTTIAFKDIDKKFNDIWRYLNKKKKPHIEQHLVRITILNQKDKIEREYDLIFKKWLSRREALNERLYRKTVNRLRELLSQPPQKKPPAQQRREEAKKQPMTVGAWIVLAFFLIFGLGILSAIVWGIYLLVHYLTH